MKKMFAKGISICLMLILTSIAVYAYPSSDMLNITGIKQEQSNWCWDAASVSILGFFGTTVTQKGFCTRVKGTIVNNAANDAEVKAGLSSYGRNSTLTASYISFPSIITQIYNYDNPIYAGWSWADGGGHALVIDGYFISDTNNVHYMDPLDGKFYSVSYNYFKGGSGYDHVWNGTLYNIS